MRIITHLILILALFTSGISPACAFMSGGKGILEICASDGSVKTIEVPEEFIPFLSDEGQPSEQDELRDMQDCPFCVNFFDAKLFSIDHDFQHLERPSNSIKISSGVFALLGAEHQGFQARAPPILS